MSLVTDIAIIGGGPAGSTAGALLRKYAPHLRVTILEKETFPREHVGESQLPPISDILDEMGCWDKVEAADFPIKIGATYRWGTSPALWDFEFLPLSEFHDEPRPAKYQGQRRRTAFQVDRARYDHILLQHARELGCEVREACMVGRVEHEGDRIAGLSLTDGSRMEARHYVDASGGSGILRRTLGIAAPVPTRLQNIAIWSYWENAEWATKIGVGGTRVLVMSIGTGWIWFIPLGPTRTSIGFICPATYYRERAVPPETLYAEALAQEPLIRSLTANATRSEPVRATRDWSFLAERMVGENWFLAGEAAGFADPILAAGMTLAHAGAREAAYTILELERGAHDAAWLKRHYEDTQKRRIGQHIRFADFWYSANGQFTDLQDYTTEIARDAGLKLSPQQAFQWLGTGGFTNDVLGQVGIGGLDLAGVRQIAQQFVGGQVTWELNKYNRLRLQLLGARQEDVPHYTEGRIQRIRCYHRRDKRLALVGTFALLVQVLGQTRDIGEICQQLLGHFSRQGSGMDPRIGLHHALQTLETMLNDGWVTGKLDPRKPRLALETPTEGAIIHPNRDIANRRVGD